MWRACVCKDLACFSSENGLKCFFTLCICAHSGTIILLFIKTFLGAEGRLVLLKTLELHVGSDEKGKGKITSRMAPNNVCHRKLEFRSWVDLCIKLSGLIIMHWYTVWIFFNYSVNIWFSWNVSTSRIETKKEERLDKGNWWMRTELR